MPMMFSSSYIELSQSALRSNVRFLRKHIGKKAEFCSVVKGNAYGHGIKHFVPMAEQCGVRQFAVFSAIEALSVLEHRTADSRIVIMGALANDELEWAIENEIAFYVFDLERLRGAQAAAKRVGKPALVHLELETGLHRTGLEIPQLEDAAAVLRANPALVQADGVCTHLAGAESVSNYLRIRNQIQSFQEQCVWLERQGIRPRTRHIACSAAAFAFPDTIMDMVRFGIAHYGYWPTKETQMQYYLEQDIEPNHRPDPLKRVITWKSRVMTIKEVKPGEFVGYGTSYQTSRKQILAAVPVGYFHGFARNLSNLGHVLIHGSRAQVAGLVNMNMMMVDVTDVAGVKKGDEVVIIGKQNKRQISVSSFSDLTRFLNYEVLVRIPSEIPRIVVE